LSNHGVKQSIEIRYRTNEENAMDTVASKKLTREGAMKVLGAAVDRSHALDCHVSIAVVDDGGHLIAFTRSERAELYSIAIAQAKAKSAALTRFPSGKKSPTGNERDDHHALAITLAAGPGSFVTIPGGFPVFSEGEIVGAVGVSGAGIKDVDIS
jgi:glc operon protein GlcG